MAGASWTLSAASRVKLTAAGKGQGPTWAPEVVAAGPPGPGGHRKAQMEKYQIDSIKYKAVSD